MLHTRSESCELTAAQNYILGRIHTVVSRLFSFLIGLFISIHSFPSIADIIAQAN